MTDWTNKEESPFRQFSLSDFKKWMDKQSMDDYQVHEDITGEKVECRVSLKKLVSKMEADDDGVVKEMAKDFKSNGGTVSSIDGDIVLVEVESGSFYIPYKYVTKNQD
jgi:hypothetical protein